MINEELACRSYRGTHIYTHIHTRHVYTIKRPTSIRRREGGCHRVTSRIFPRNFSTTLCAGICRKTTTETKSLHARSKFLGCDALGLPFPVALDVFDEDSLSIRRWHFTWFFYIRRHFSYIYTSVIHYCGVDFKTDKNVLHFEKLLIITRISAFRYIVSSHFLCFGKR